jgi:hypothetical protein
VDGETRSDHESVEQIGVHGPQRGEVATVLRYDHVPLDRVAERIE